jgi:molybdopterin-guanine dinucleotide biosynthesis protein A
MPGRDERTAVVLAGGFSTRFDGGDKALADFGDRPLVGRVADRLASVCGTVVLNCRDEQADALSAAVADCGAAVSVATDPEPDRGPVAGILTGLRAVETEYAAVVACDMPFVDPEFVAYLFERAQGADGAVPRLDDGWFQTTQAVYRTAAMADACERALSRGEAKVLAAVDELDHVVVSADEVRAHAAADTFENVNTREELAVAVRRATAEESTDAGGDSTGDR